MKEDKRNPSDIMSLMSSPPQNLEDIFSHFDELAKECFQDIYSLRPYSDLLADHSKKILDQKHTRETIDKALEKLQKDMLSYNSNLDYYGKMCLTFRTMADQLNRESNHPAAIWGLIMSAYFLGATNIASEIITNKHIDTLEKNEAAAKAKNAAYAESRSYFIQSIHEKSPPNGWKTKNHLASELSEHIAHYERTIHNLKTSQDITVRLLRWAREYPDVALAVSQHVRRKGRGVDSR